MKPDPFLPSFRLEVDRLFDTLVHTAWGSVPAERWTPQLDVIEEPERYRLEMDLPGVSTEALSIATESGTLRIEGSRERARRGGSERHHLVERPCGHFVRTIRLPVDADVHRMRVRLDQGVLTVEIPRARGRRVR